MRRSGWAGAAERLLRKTGKGGGVLLFACSGKQELSLDPFEKQEIAQQAVYDEVIYAQSTEQENARCNRNSYDAAADHLWEDAFLLCHPCKISQNGRT